MNKLRFPECVKERTMMSKKEYIMAIVSLFGVLLAGCGVEDKALELTPRSVAEAEVDDGINADDTLSGENVQESVLYVHVCGAVVTPGVVRLPAGSRVEDALEAAGGFAEDAQINYVNLASRLEDGQQLYFPTIGEAEALKQEAQELERLQQQASSGIVDINTADAALLCTLPGIGEARARVIIDYREQNGPFEKIEDIMRVPGIKESAFAKLKSRIVVN